MIDPSIPLKVAQPNFDYGDALKTASLINQSNAQTKQIEQENAAMPMQNEIKQFAFAKEKLNVLKNLVTDLSPENYQARRDLALEMGLTTPDKLPEQFDPNLANKWLTETEKADMELDRRVKEATIRRSLIDQDTRTASMKDTDAQLEALRNKDSLRYNLLVANANTYGKGLTTDPNTNQIITAPGYEEAIKNIEGGKAEATASGKVTGERAAKLGWDMPDIKTQYQYSNKLLDELLAHPGLKGAVGVKSPEGLFNAKFAPGSAEAGFQARLKQIQGRSFLEAYEKLKGAGQITEVEGEKATAAINRMSTATSEEEFISAVNDLRSVIESSYKNAETRYKKYVLGEQTSDPLEESAPENNQKLDTLPSNARFLGEKDGVKFYMTPDKQIIKEDNKKDGL